MKHAAAASGDGRSTKIEDRGQNANNGTFECTPVNPCRRKGLSANRNIFISCTAVGCRSSCARYKPGADYYCRVDSLPLCFIRIASLVCERRRGFGLSLEKTGMLAPFAGAEGVLEAGLIGIRGVFGSLHTTYTSKYRVRWN